MRSPQGHACSGYMKRLAPSLPLFAALLGLVAIGGCSTPGARDSGFPACTWPAIYDTEAAASGAGGALRDPLVCLLHWNLGFVA